MDFLGPINLPAENGAGYVLVVDLTKMIFAKDCILQTQQQSCLTSFDT